MAAMQKITVATVLAIVAMGIVVSALGLQVATRTISNTGNVVYFTPSAWDKMKKLILAFLLLPILGYRNIFLFAFLPGIIAVFFILFIKISI